MALKLDQIRALAERVAASHGLEVVDVEYAGGGGKHRTLRVFIEKDAGQRAKLREQVARLRAEREARRAVEGPGVEMAEDAILLDELPTVENPELLAGITHEDCEVFSRDFGTVLDVEELVPGTEYLLEVSSPGLDRRLTRIEEYRRFVGSLVKLQTREPVAGARHFEGRIAEVGDGTVAVQVRAGGKGGKGSKRGSGAGPKGQMEAQPDARVEVDLGNVEKAQLVPEF